MLHLKEVDLLHLLCQMMGLAHHRGDATITLAALDVIAELAVLPVLSEKMD